MNSTFDLPPQDSGTEFARDQGEDLSSRRISAEGGGGGGGGAGWGGGGGGWWGGGGGGGGRGGGGGGGGDGTSEKGWSTSGVRSVAGAGFFAYDNGRAERVGLWARPVRALPMRPAIQRHWTSQRNVRAECVFYPKDVESLELRSAERHYRAMRTLTSDRVDRIGYPLRGGRAGFCPQYISYRISWESLSAVRPPHRAVDVLIAWHGQRF